MKYLKCLLAVVTAVSLCFMPAWAELSSRAKKAEKLCNLGNLPEAMEIYKSLMSKNPQKDADLVKEGREGMAVCLVAQGKAALTAQKPDEAKAAFLTVVKEYKDTLVFKDASKYLIDAQLALSTQLETDGKFEECAAQGRDVKALVSPQTEGYAALNKMIADASMKWGEGLAKQQKNEEAQAVFEQIATEFADNVDVAASSKRNASQCAYALGVCFRLSKKTDKAITAYQAVTVRYKNTPVAAAAYADLYDIYVDQNDQVSALDAIKQAVAGQPGNSDYLFKEVSLLADMGKTEEAQKYAAGLLSMLQDEVERAYTNKDVLQYKLGATQLILNNYSEAAVEFDKALARNPSLLEAKRGLASAQFNDKNFTGALTTYDALLNQYAAAFADATQKLAADKESPELAKKAEQLRKEIAFFHYQKSLCLEQLGDYDKALSECRLGLEGVPTKEAAVTLKRIQGAAQKKAEQIPSPK
jgi:tetratricopeptide (TPR) repeat protein